MSQDSTLVLKKKFTKVFPEQAQLLNLAKSQDEINELHTRFVHESKQNAIESMKNFKFTDKDKQKIIKYVKNSKLSDKDKQKIIKSIKNFKFTDKDKQKIIKSMKSVKKSTSGVQNIDAFGILNTPYLSLIKAKGKHVKQEIQKLLNTIADLKSLKFSTDHSKIAAGLSGTGITILGIAAFTALQIFLNAMSETTTFLIVTLIAATSSIAITIVALTVLVLAIAVPMIYFSVKPANCLILLINELDKPITFLEDYSNHGKPNVRTNEIPSCIMTSDGKPLCPAAGFISCVKHTGALYGTQYGFTMKYGKTSLSFGVDNPLSSIYKDNNCFCKINSSAKHAAKRTDHYNKQYFTYEKDGITVSIRCNSKKGSTAYYVARAYKTPLG